MKKLILIACAWSLLSCANTRYYASVGAGDNSGNWDDCGNTGSYFGLGSTTEVIKDFHIEVAYDHYSQWSCGWPANDREGESYLNHWGARGKYYF